MGKKILFLSVLSLVAATILGVFLLVLLPDKALQPQALQTVPAQLDAPEITFLDPVRGNPEAKITVIEYGDFACPLCQRAESELAAFIAEAPKQRRLVWKDAPNTAAHPEAFTLSMAARCAQDQGAFWAYHDELFAAGGNLNASQLRLLAEQLSLDGEAFASCMASGITRPIVQHTLDEAIALNIPSTPAIYINGVVYTGPITLVDLQNAVRGL